MSENGAAKVEAVGLKGPEEPPKTLNVVMPEGKLQVVAVQEVQQTMQPVMVDHYQKRFSLPASQGSERCCRCSRKVQLEVEVEGLSERVDS